MLTVPLSFDPPPWDEPDAHLDLKEENGVVSATWRTLGLTVFYTETTDFPELEDFAKHTPGLFFHGHSGFSIGQYSELFVDSTTYDATYNAMTFGNIEVTFGQSSPLAIHMFDRYQDKNFHGKWRGITSIRIYGTSRENAEAVLLNAINRYYEKFGVQLEVNEIAAIDWLDEDDDSEEDFNKNLHNYPPTIPNDIEPLRCYYYARTNPEPAAACIQYYRVLEYYAFLSQHTELAKQRHDLGLSDRDFLFSASKLLTRNEKGPLLNLITEIADPVLLKQAVSDQLISTPNGKALGEALYEFRNSVVHAKYGHRAELLVDSVISPARSTQAWRRIFETLAKAAIHTCGSQLRL